MEVVAAVIERDGLILIARRPAASHLGGLWEFPGGKRDVGREPGGRARAGDPRGARRRGRGRRRCSRRWTGPIPRSGSACPSSGARSRASPGRSKARRSPGSVPPSWAATGFRPPTRPCWIGWAAADRGTRGLTRPGPDAYDAALLSFHTHSLQRRMQRMSRRLTAIVLALLTLAVLAPPALAQKPVKIGVLTPLSPPGDPAAGQLIVRGAKMAADEINAKGILGGRKIELVIEDDSGHAREGRGRLPQARDPGRGGGGDGPVPQLGGAGGAGPGRAVQGADLRDPGLGARLHREAPQLQLPHPRHRHRPGAAAGTAGSRTRASRRSRCSRRTPTTGWAWSRTPRSSSPPPRAERS